MKKKSNIKKKKKKFFFWKVNKISSERFQKIFAWCNVWAPKNSDNKKVHLNCRQTNTHKKFSKPSCVSHIENFCKYFFGIYKKKITRKFRTHCKNTVDQTKGSSAVDQVKKAKVKVRWTRPTNFLSPKNTGKGYTNRNLKHRCQDERSPLLLRR